MIVIDTNVISALMLATPDPAVVSWLDLQPPESIWTTAVTVFEVEYGLKAMPPGKRRNALEEAFAHALEQDMANRVLDFDTAAARQAATLASQLRTLGRPVDMRDIQIAGIVAARRGVLATRNTRHFNNMDLALINPWETGR